MRSILSIGILYICLALFLSSCTESDPAPAPVCLEAEVVGPDCDTGWYILKLEKNAENGSCQFVGQLQSGYVTTDNLPDAYKQPGRRIGVAVELIGDYGPTCVTIAVMYPAVRVKRVCAESAANGDRG